jgi:hypothetical protein
VYDNTTGEPRDFYVFMGTEQVIVHQAVSPRVYGLWPWEGAIEGGTSVQILGDSFVKARRSRLRTSPRPMWCSSTAT